MITIAFQRYLTIALGISFVIVSVCVPLAVIAQDSDITPQAGALLKDVNCWFDESGKENCSDADCGFGESGKENCGIKHLFILAKNLVNVLIWLAAIGVALVIVWYGAMLALNAFVPGDYNTIVKKSQKAILWAMAGLVLVLGSWLIVDFFYKTLGYTGTPLGTLPAIRAQTPPPQTPPPGEPPPPTVVNGQCGTAVNACTVGTLNDIADTEDNNLWQCTGSGGGTTDSCSVPIDTPPPPAVPSGTCADCRDYSGVIPCKDGCKINQDLGEKLVALKDEEGAEWRVTEGWPPTANHRNDCHRDGSCVDVNFINKDSDATTDNIKAFIDRANRLGLEAVYETNDGEVYNALFLSGIPNNCREGGGGGVCFLSGITAPHFSVYNK